MFDNNLITTKAYKLFKIIIIENYWKWKKWLKIFTRYQTLSTIDTDRYLWILIKYTNKSRLMLYDVRKWVWYDMKTYLK